MIWLLLMSSQPHKEERFMYVIYPGILLISSYLISLLGRKTQYFIIFVVFSISISRIGRIYSGYSAPMAVWQGIHSEVCVGKDWHLFPSSYFFQGELKYYSDGFKGLLPGKFGENAKMNNLNQEEIDRYIDILDCEFVAVRTSENDLLRSEFTDWEVAKTEPYLDSSTPQPFRSFYLGRSNYGKYLLLKNPKFKSN